MVYHYAFTTTYLGAVLLPRSPRLDVGRAEGYWPALLFVSRGRWCGCWLGGLRPMRRTVRGSGRVRPAARTARLVVSPSGRDGTQTQNPPMKRGSIAILGWTLLHVWSDPRTRAPIARAVVRRKRSLGSGHPLTRSLVSSDRRLHRGQTTALDTSRSRGRGTGIRCSWHGHRQALEAARLRGAAPLLAPWRLDVGAAGLRTADAFALRDEG